VKANVQSLLRRHLFQVPAAEPAEETRQSGVPSLAQPGTHVRIIQDVPELTKGNMGRSNTANIRSEVLRVVACQTNMVMGPAGPETKNGCAGEGQQQINRPVQIRVMTL
jgi:hypothetical protein